MPELFIDGPRHRIAYRRAGAGRPLVLLHPLALSGEVWGTYGALLAQSFDVIAPDARGHGHSGWDGEPFGVDDLADDVAALLDGLGLETALVGGMSMGGSTAVSFAGRHPSRTERLLLADTTAWYGADAPATWEARAQGVVAKPRQAQVAFQADRWFTAGFRERDADEVNRVVEIFLRTDSRAHAEACRALGTMDSRRLLPAITAPTLVVTGEEDYATPPAMGKAIADGVPAGSALVLPALRHMSLVEDPGLAGLTAEFLAAEGARL
ncbi:MAG TPA: alpha/beta fold hydrolase [Trebonia sp.]|jgi:3-oxoadipate enol-lactonase|nr:alpha/beta fold hydrolase [Trebonia sp.]